MLFREKTKLAAPGNVTGTRSFSVFRNAWRAVSSLNPAQSFRNHASMLSSASLPTSVQATRSLERDFGKQDCPAELHGVIDVLGTVRRRILTNIFLQGTTKWWTWVLIGLIVVAAISVKMAGVLILAAILAVVGTAFILTWVWRTRPSMYGDAACRLDSAAGLHDRVSTSLFLCDVKPGRNDSAPAPRCPRTAGEGGTPRVISSSHARGCEPRSGAGFGRRRDAGLSRES